MDSFVTSKPPFVTEKGDNAALLLA